MSEMANYPYLHQRGPAGRFVYRRRVPDRIRPFIGVREIVVTLKTSDKTKALEAYRRVDGDTAQRFATAEAEAAGSAHPGKLSVDLSMAAVRSFSIDVDDVIEDYLKKVLAEELRFRREQSQYLTDNPGRFKSMPVSETPEFVDWLYNGRRSSRVLPDENGLLAEALNLQLSRRTNKLRHMLASNSVELLRRHLSTGVSVDLNEADVVRCIERELRLYELILEKPHAINSDLVGISASISENAASSQGPVSASRPSNCQADGVPLLSSALAIWLDEQKSFTDERRKRAEVDVRDFIDVVGDRLVDEYRKTDGAKFKRVLVRAPANIEKRLRKLGLSKRDLEKAADRAADCGLEPQSSASVNKKLGIVGQFFRSMANEYDDVINPVANLRVPDAVDPRSATDIFTSDDLNHFFADPTLTVQQSWLCLIGLYTGMRLSEIVQLRREHFISHPDGFYCLTLPCDLKLKNSQSCRSVPVHEALIALGIVAYVDASEGHFFPVFQGGASDRLHDKASKWFNRRLARMGLKTDRKNFHSFRHTWEHACRRAGVGGQGGYEKFRLSGEKPSGRGGRYGSRWDQERLDEEFLRLLNHELQKISYRELDLTKIPSISGAMEQQQHF